MNDLTQELRVSDFSANEFLALLAMQFQSTSLDPNSGQHTTMFGEDELRVIFKSGTRQILRVQSMPSMSKATRRELRKLVEKALNPDAADRVASRVVMSRGQWNRRPFRWCEKWQLGRIPAGAPIPKELSGLFPVLLQFTYKHVGIPWLDHVRKDLAFQRTFLPLVPLTHWLGTGLVDTTGAVPQNAWAFLPSDEPGQPGTCSWVSLGYFIPDELLSPGFHEYEHLARWDPDTVDSTDFFRCAAQEWLLRLESLSIEGGEKFMRGCQWFNRALTAKSSTDALLDMVILIESLLPSDFERCKECNAPVYSIGDRFRDFLMRHGGPPPGDSEEGHAQFKRFASRLYRLRSAVAHRGYAVAAEGLGFGVGFVPVDWSERDCIHALRSIGGRLLLSWAAEQIQAFGGPSSEVPKD